MNTGVGVLPAGSKTWISDMEEKGIYENVLGNMAEFIPQMFAFNPCK